jgi:hypothetical protein
MAHSYTVSMEIFMIDAHQTFRKVVEFESIVSTLDTIVFWVNVALSTFVLVGGLYVSDDTSSFLFAVASSGLLFISVYVSAAIWFGLSYTLISIANSVYSDQSIEVGDEHFEDTDFSGTI